MNQGQRVRRVIRHIDTWSVLRVAVLFYLSLMLVVVVAGVMLWAGGSVVGAVGGVEDFMRGIGFDGFEFVGGQLLRGFIAIGLILVVLGTGSTVLATVLYNLIADVVGGVQLTVLEEVYVTDEHSPEVVVDAEVGTEAVAGAVPDEASPEPPPPVEPEHADLGTPAAPEPEPEPESESEPVAASVEPAPTEPEPVAATEDWPDPADEVAAVAADKEAAEEVGDEVAADEEADEPVEARTSTRSSAGPSGWTTPAW